MLDVAANLFVGGHVVNLGIGGLDFDDAARGQRDSQQGSVFIRVFELVGSEQAAVRQARATVLNVDETTDLGFERLANGVEEIGQRGVAGSFPDRRAGGANGAQFFEISFKGVGHHCWK